MIKNIVSGIGTLLLCGTVSAQSQFFNTIGAPREIGEQVPADTVTQSSSMEQERQPTPLQSFIKGLSLNELEYVTEQYRASHIQNFPADYSVTTQKKGKGLQRGRMKFYTGESHPLTIRNLLAVMDEVGVTNRLIVLSQALLETGYFTSRVCKAQNNLFGLVNPLTGKYMDFERWEDSVIGYKKFIQYKYKGGSYLGFLRRIGYAEDPRYTQKVLSISNKLHDLDRYID